MQHLEIDSEDGVTEPANAAFARQPALDGVRAVAVALVLIFHAGFRFMPAGYLGVSVFFTLSGYLITSLLLGEHASTGRVAYGTFWARRLRRLLPASLLCLGLVIVASALGAFSRVEGLRIDVVGAVLQVFNWVQLVGTDSYGDLFGTITSPLEHYWSLAIEEQFYWFWPVVLVGLLAIARRFRWSLLALVGGLTVAMSLTAVVIAVHFGPDAAYWATPARFPEILVGAFIAVWLATPRTLPARLSWLAPIALTVIIALSCLWPSASGPAYDGALPLFAVVSGALIVGLQQRSRLRSMLSLRPLVWMGGISYGLYLFHWPVFVVLRERGWRIDNVGGFAVALAITFGLAMLSSSLVERPIRLSTWSFQPTFGMGIIASAFVVGAAGLLVTPGAAVQADDDLLAAAAIAPTDSLAPLAPRISTTTVTTTMVPTTTVKAPIVADPADDATTTVAPTSTTTSVPVFPLQVPLGAAPSRPVRVLVVGDSTSLYVAQGLAAWSITNPAYAQVDSRWCQGCTFMLEPAISMPDFAPYLDNARAVIGEELPATVQELQPDVVVLMVTVNDIANRTWSDDEGPLSPSDPRFAERLTASYVDLSNSLLDAGVAHVVWVVPPTPTVVWKEPEFNDPERYVVHHEVIADVVASFEEATGSGRVSLVDLDRWMKESGHADDDAWRPDRVHLDPDHATEIAAGYLGPLLVERALGP